MSRKPLTKFPHEKLIENLGSYGLLAIVVTAYQTGLTKKKKNSYRRLSFKMKISDKRSPTGFSCGTCSLHYIHINNIVGLNDSSENLADDTKTGTAIEKKTKMR